MKDSIHRADFGYRAGLGDSGIVMVKSPVVFGYSRSGTTANVSGQNLSEINIQRKASIGGGILFPAGTKTDFSI